MIKFIKLILFYLFGIALLACNKDSLYVGKETMLVASKTVGCGGMMGLGQGGTCYLVKTNSNKNWDPYSIYMFEGFEYKEGFESLIIVKVYKTFHDNEPIMDGDSRRYVLYKIISQVKKDSNI